MRRSSGPVAGAPAAVLIHGVVSTRYLLPTATAFARRCAVLAPDLPGFGQSSRSRRKVAIEDQADLLDKLIAWAGFRRPTVLGHSVGAQVAASLALRHPEAVGVVGPGRTDRRPQGPQRGRRLRPVTVHRPGRALAVQRAGIARTGGGRLTPDDSDATSGPGRSFPGQPGPGGGAHLGHPRPTAAWRHSAGRRRREADCARRVSS